MGRRIVARRHRVGSRAALGRAKNLFNRGQAAESKDDPITAYENYYQAWEKEPKNLRYKTAYERLRFQAGAAHVSKGKSLPHRAMTPQR